MKQCYGCNKKRAPSEYELCKECEKDMDEANNFNKSVEVNLC